MSQLRFAFVGCGPYTATWKTFLCHASGRINNSGDHKADQPFNKTVNCALVPLCDFCAQETKPKTGIYVLYIIAIRY